MLSDPPRSFSVHAVSLQVIEISLGASRGKMDDFPFAWASSGGLAEILTNDIDVCIRELVHRNINLSSLTVRSMNLRTCS